MEDDIRTWEAGDETDFPAEAAIKLRLLPPETEAEEI